MLKAEIENFVEKHKRDIINNYFDSNQFYTKRQIEKILKYYVVHKNMDLSNQLISLLVKFF